MATSTITAPAVIGPRQARVRPRPALGGALRCAEQLSAAQERSFRLVRTMVASAVREQEPDLQTLERLQALTHALAEQHKQTAQLAAALGGSE